MASTSSAHRSKASRRSGRTTRATVTVTGSAVGVSGSAPNTARSRRGTLTGRTARLAPLVIPVVRGLTPGGETHAGDTGQVPEGDTVWLAAQRMQTALAGATLR